MHKKAPRTPSNIVLPSVQGTKLQSDYRADYRESAVAREDPKTSMPATIVQRIGIHVPAPANSIPADADRKDLTIDQNIKDVPVSVGQERSILATSLSINHAEQQAAELARILKEVSHR